jgi:parallel beta-helix repeat protein
MKRFITSLALLAVLVWLGCEKQEGPVSPSQDQQTKATTGNATMAKLKENVEAWKAKVEERAAALKIQAAKLRQRQLSKSAAGGKITVPDDYPTIQDAVNAAAPGTKILVKDGAYNEEVTVITNNLTITPAHAGQAHVIGGFELTGVTKGKIEGFDITGGVFLEECTKVEVKENEVKEGFGIVLFASVDCVVKDNKVHDNSEIFEVPPGITIFFGGKHLVAGNESRANYFGIVVFGGLAGEVGPSPGKNVIRSNECTGSLVGILLLGSHENDLGDNASNANIGIGGGIGIFLCEDSDRNKIGSGNEANGNRTFGIYLDGACDNNTVKKNAAHGNGVCDAIDEGTGNTFTQNNFGSVCP